LIGALAGVITHKDGLQTLVLLDNWAYIETHSVFFDILKRDGGHTLTFNMITEPFSIKYAEDTYFDNIILMATSARDLKSPVNQRDLIEYLESNHNLMIFADIDSRVAIRNLFNEFGADLEGVSFIL